MTSVNSGDRVCRVCGELKPIEQFRRMLQFRGGEQREYHYYECNSCRNDKRRQLAIARGLKRAPCAIINGKIIYPEKQCNKCGEVKAIDQFRVKTYGYREGGERYPRALATHCLDCEKEHKGHYYDRKADEFKEKQRRLREKDPQTTKESAKRSYLKKTLKKYGLTPADYYRMYSEQDGKCQICGASRPRLAVDHCHATNTVRGLLCVKCNSALGLLGEDVVSMFRMIDYVRRYNGIRLVS